MLSNFNITAYYATGHGFRFFADALEDWHPEKCRSVQVALEEKNEADGWVWAWEMASTVNVPVQLDPEATALNVAEQVFAGTNTDPEWHRTVNFSESRPNHLNARSLCAGDVLHIVDQDGNEFTLGCDSCGWRVL